MSETRGGPLRRVEGRWALALAVLALLPYLGLLASGWADPMGGEFVLDDRSAIAGSRCVTGGFDPALIFGRNFWCQGPEAHSVDAWRPAPVLLWHLLWRAGAGPAAFRAVAVGLHLACTLLLWHLARALGAETRAAGLGAAFFALVPIHVDAVANGVGMAESLSLLGIMAAGLAALRARVVGVALAVAIALMSKESGVVAILLVALVAGLGPSPARPDCEGRRWIALGVAVAVGIGLLSVRAQVLGGWSARHLTVHVNPLLAATPLERLLAGPGLLARYLLLALGGGPLSADYAHAAIPVRGPELVGSAVAGTLALAGAFAGLYRARRRSPERLWWCWLLAASALLTQWVTLLPAIFAERLFFGASAPLALLLGAGLARGSRALERRSLAAARVGYLALALVAAWYATATWQHARAWASEDGITAVTVRHQPRSARAHMWRARVLARSAAGDPSRTELMARHAAAAARIAPDWAVPRAYQAVALDLAGEPEAALGIFLQAFERDPAAGEVADLFEQFLRRYGHEAQAQELRRRHAAARLGADAAGPW